MNKKKFLHVFATLIFLGVASKSLAFESSPIDTVPLRDRSGDYLRDSVTNPFYLRDPQFIEKQVEYDPVTNKYYVTEKIGDYYYRTPTVMTFEEYTRYKAKQQERAYFERLAGLTRRRNGELVDPLSKINFDATQNNKLKMLLKSAGVNGKLPEVPKLDIKKMGDNLIGMIFGDPPTVDIRPQGQIDLTLGADYRRFDNPVLPEFARTNGGLLFNMDIQMNVTGKIGEKLNLNTSFNNKATFDFDNIMKLNYNSNVFSEDDIIKSIEGGNVNLPLRGTLIQGSQNLFGIKTELQFGHLRLTAIAAQQRNRRNNVNVSGGSQLQTFNVASDQYDENRHFFLTHFNRNTFEPALKTLPLINSQFSITKLEVWVSNDRNEDREIRQIVALADLGEGEKFTPRLGDGRVTTRTTPGARRDLTNTVILPDNNANDLYSRIIADEDRTRRIDRAVNTLESGAFDLQQGRHFVKRAMKRLQPSEYSYNEKLGIISVNNVDRQQIVGVSFTYFYNGQGPFQVGEFAENVSAITGIDASGKSDSISKILFVKMLKNTTLAPDIPLFDLMMKNVYSVGAYVTNPQDLQIDIVYQDPGENSTDPDAGKAEKRALAEAPKFPLLQLLNLDRLNQVGDPQPDGQFDFVPNVTINTRNGRVMFPVLEPFGSYLRDRVNEITGTTIGEKYNYSELYDSTLFRAQEKQEKNRFFIRGRVKSSASNKIQLNAFGLRPGAVTVTAGAYQLTEGVDYAIDYGTSSLTVLNPAYVAPNIPLNISYEDNALFGLQTRTMLGLRADYQLKKNFNIGATYMNLFEIPFTQKVNFGDDPINNKVYGLDINFSEDAPWLTKLVDKIPFIDTKEPSKITLSAEGALLRPGHSKAINLGCDSGGSVYLDDFEGSSNPFSLLAQPGAWSLSSVPRTTLYPESNKESTFSGVNRAMLNWYRIDPTLLQGERSGKPEERSPFVDQIVQQEVFPNRSVNNDANFGGNLNAFLPTLDLTYRPKVRGPYNFDIPGGHNVNGLKISEGLRGDGSLNRPETRWAGITRGITTTDFEASNVEYIDFWMLDPFLDESKLENNKGKLFFHLGDISEDILRDSRKSYENGLPGTLNPDLKTDKSVWGRVPRTELPLPNSSSADSEDRNLQDVGLDGFDNNAEQTAFQGFLQQISSLSPAAQSAIRQDPANDDFFYYDDRTLYPEGTDVLTRYSEFNGLERNSASNTGIGGSNSSTNLPDAEDANRDNSFEENEAFFEYELPLEALPGGYLNTSRFGKYYIESLDADQKFHTPPAGFKRRRWHHFRIPLSQFDGKFGSITDFRSIRFMRMVVKGFSEETTIRMAKLDLIRNQWRRYSQRVAVDGGTASNRLSSASVELNAVNIEENSQRRPFNYVVPSCIPREPFVQSFAAGAFQNEQSLSLNIKDLRPSEGAAAFKLFNTDMRVYERLKMFIHAESTEGSVIDKKMCVFMRVGSDFENNYYEYEIPLLTTDANLPPLTNPTVRDKAYEDAVWRSENTFDFPLSLFTDVKRERNKKGASFVYPYSITDPSKPENKVKVVGNPDIGLVENIMVGVYNKDSKSHDVEIWINELRTTGLNEKAGGAALGRVDFKLADFGNVTVSGNYLGIGYGAIDQRVTQRSREEVTEVGVTGTFELGKFLPQKSGIKVPITVQYSNNVRTPEFDPYDLDIRLKDKLSDETNGQKRDSIKNLAATIQTIKGYSFNNVRKERTGTKKPQPWDIENFSVSYGYTEVERRDPLVESDSRLDYKGSLDYNFSREPLYIAPFKNVIKNEKVAKYTKLLSDFNFNPIPNSFGFNTILDRQINVTKYRFSGNDEAYNTFYQRRFGWDRNYNMQWDLTRLLKLNYDAKVFAVVDELFDYDTKTGVATEDKAKNDYLWENVKNFGRTKRYDQNINVNYTLPTRNIPFMDWVNVRATYTGSYGWEAFAFNPQIDNEPQYRFQEIGNFINNKQARQVSADLNFDNLYNYVKYLRKIQTPRQPTTKGKKKKEEATPSVPNTAATPDSAQTKKKKRGEYEPGMAERILIRPLLALRKARISYNEQLGSFVPGFLPQGRLFGMQDLTAPGWDYALGLRQADDDWLENARTQNWISNDYRQTRPALNNLTQTLDVRLTVEPIPDFRIDLDLNRNYVKNQSQEFRNPTFTRSLDSIGSFNRFDDGSYTISYFTMNTLFKDIDEVYNTFKNNRALVSQTLGANEPNHPEFPGFKQGYGPTNQDVLIPAFIAAYTGRDARTSNRNLFSERPSFNWRLSYNGLSKLPGLRDKFSNINITHGYKSTFTVNSFRTDPFFDGANPRKTQVESKFEYYTQFDIPTIVIAEQFAPLLGIDVTMKTGANFGVQYRMSRNLALSTSDTRLQETKTSEISVKFGHRLKNIYIKFLDFDLEKKKKKQKEEEDAAKAADPTDPSVPNDPNAPKTAKGKKKRAPKPKKGNDLVLSFDLAYRNDETENRLLQQDVSTPSRGSRTLRIAPSATYTVNKRLDLRFYIDYNKLIPFTTQSFPSVTTTGGFVVTFKLN